MPTSYQAPMRQDREQPGSKSQTVTVGDHHANVSEILDSKGREVFSIRPDETLGQAVKELRDRRIGALTVTDGEGGLVGILSERDIVRKLAETPGQTLPQQVGDVMTTSVETCAPEEALVTVLKRMTNGRFRHMPVMDNEKLVGMVTIGDVINHRLTEVEHEALHLKQLITG
ncbi:CBS domain-containing protein [Amaricoccus tamworthensis]|uniref:CBS domain-containing protein n=1 Tax=Amaricoccus tamworthensis TaxID=57002 RepID=UPI003C7E990A